MTPPWPFDSYPKDEKELKMKLWKGGNSRRGYGLVFLRNTHQTKCAYCEAELTNTYETWLSMVLDHVVPISVCRELGVEEWCDSLANAVLACAACNGFDNRYEPSKREVTTFQEFLALRDEIFIKRRERVQRKHESEKKFFEDKIAPFALKTRGKPAP